MKLYDIIIIGAGPAGMSAAVYGTRAGKSVMVLEAIYHGGQASTTSEIDNYLGFPNGIPGPELMHRFHEQAARFGTEFVYEEFLELREGEPLIVKTTAAEYSAKNVIIATGATPSPLGVDGEDRLRGAGVSYCATCDGAFFRGKTVAVVGGGNTAVEEAIYLAEMCEKVYLIHRRDELRADSIIANAAIAHEKIEILWNTTVKSIEGEDKVEHLILNDDSKLEVSGIFIAVGTLPNSTKFQGTIEMDAKGFIITDSLMKTNVANVFAIGDVRNTPLRQVITAAADGAIAASNVIVR